MTFKRKQWIALAAFALATNAVSVASLYYLARQHFFDEYRAKLLSIAVTSASLLDGERLKTIRERSDERLPAYAELRGDLQRIRNANWRPDTIVHRLFTIMRSPVDAGVLEIGVDAEEQAGEMGHAGEVYRAGDHPPDIATAWRCCRRC